MIFALLSVNSCLEDSQASQAALIPEFVLAPRIHSALELSTNDQKPVLESAKQQARRAEFRPQICRKRGLGERNCVDETGCQFHPPPCHQPARNRHPPVHV